MWKLKRIIYIDRGEEKANLRKGVSTSVENPFVGTRIGENRVKSVPGGKIWYPRIQILAIEDLLAGKTVEYLRLLDVTYKKAPKSGQRRRRRRCWRLKRLKRKTHSEDLYPPAFKVGDFVARQSTNEDCA